MARRRNVYALRQILAKDVNDQNDFRIADFQHIIRDVIGASSGVVSGLAGSYIGQTVTITSGSITDGETIFELLEDGTLLIPTTNGTYKIYATQSSTNDLPISGFKLIDIETRAETYDTVNSRTYDSITIGYTTGTIPANSEQIGTVVVSGGVIVSYTDNRGFITIGNLTAYSLQNFAVSGYNTITDTGRFSSIIGDLTNHHLVNATASNTNAVTLFKINNGTNSGSIAFEVTSSGNTSYKSINGSNSIGFSSIGSNLTNTVGFQSNNNLINYSSTLLANSTGYKVTGVNNNDIGFHSVNINTGILVDNENQNVGVGVLSKNIYIKSGASNGVNNNPISFVNEYVSGVYSSIKESGVGFVSEWKDANTLSESFIGFRAVNNAKNDGSIGFASISNPTGLNDVSLFDFEIGFISAYSSDTNFLSYQNKNTIGFSTRIDESGDNNGFLTTVGFKSIIGDESTGLIIDNDGSGDNSFGIIGTSGNSSKFFKKFIEINNSQTGIDIIGNVTNSVTGINISDYDTSIKITGESATSSIGISIDKAVRAIDINNLGADDVDIGIHLTQVNRPIIIKNVGSGGFNSSEYAIKLDLNNQQHGINIINSKGSAIRFNNTYSGSIFMADIEFSSNNTNVMPHMTCISTPTSLPSTTYFGVGTSALQFYNNGSVNQLKFWDGSVWRTVNVT